MRSCQILHEKMARLPLCGSRRDFVLGVFLQPCFYFGISMHFHTPCLLGEFDPLTIFREKSCCGLGHGHRKSLELASGNAMSFKWDQHLYLDYLADGIIVVSALNPHIEAHEILPFGSP